MKSINANWTIIVSVVAICFSFLFFSYYIWPTPYFYTTAKETVGVRSRETVIKTNRFTGHSEQIFPILESEKKPHVSTSLPQDVLQNVTTEVERQQYPLDHVELKIHNGTEWTITEVFVEIVYVPEGGNLALSELDKILRLDDKGPKSWRRSFRKESTVSPYSSASLVIDTNEDRPNGNFSIWKVEAQGHVAKE